MLLEPLGEGGMARVFVAQKDGATDVCVLKQLHVQLEQNSEAAKRFIREANIASQLTHPNIAEIVDAGVEGGRFCLAMEFIAGQTVEAMVKKAKEKGGILPLEISIPIVLQSLDALAYAHALRDQADGKPLGLVHRDLSPRNVMLDYAGRAKLIDFGIAKGDVDEYKTAAGVLMGTPYYMSPEQARALSVDKRSDLYTLAAVFFEMLTGKRLVQAKGRAKILMTVARQLAPPVSSVNPNVPKALDPVLQKALAKKPEERFADADAFAAALRLAAGEAAFTTQDVLGAFLRDLFPEGEAKAAAIIHRARQAAADVPPVEATRVAGGEAVMPSPLSTPAELGGKTRTGYLDPNLDPGGTPAPFDPAATSSPAHFQTFADPATFDPASTNLVSRTTLPPQRSPWPKVAIGLLGVLILFVAGLLFQITDDEQPPLAAPITELKTQAPTAPTVTAVAEPKQAEPPPRPAPATRTPPPPRKVSRRRVHRAPPPPPPPQRAKERRPAKGPHADLRARLERIRRSGNLPAAHALAIEIHDRAEQLPSAVASRVRSETNIARRTGDIEAVMEALDLAVSLLEKHGKR